MLCVKHVKCIYHIIYAQDTLTYTCSSPIASGIKPNFLLLVFRKGNVEHIPGSILKHHFLFFFLVKTNSTDWRLGRYANSDYCNVL